MRNLGDGRCATTLMLAVVVLESTARNLRLLMVSDCLMTIFTCTDLLGALLGTAGSNVGVRHDDVGRCRVTESLQQCDEDVGGELVC